jgi:hypothetical protein
MFSKKKVYCSLFITHKNITISQIYFKLPLTALSVPTLNDTKQKGQNTYLQTE